MGVDCNMSIVTLRGTQAKSSWRREPRPTAEGENARFGEFMRNGLWPAENRNSHTFDLLTGGCMPSNLNGVTTKFPEARAWDDLPFEREILRDDEDDIWRHWLTLSDFDDFRARGGWDQTHLYTEVEATGWVMLAWAKENYGGDPFDALERHFPDRRPKLFEAHNLPAKRTDEMRRIASRCAHAADGQDRAELEARSKTNWWGRHKCFVDFTNPLADVCPEALGLERLMRALLEERDVRDVVAAFSFWY